LGRPSWVNSGSHTLLQFDALLVFGLNKHIANHQNGNCLGVADLISEIPLQEHYLSSHIKMNSLKIIDYLFKNVFLNKSDVDATPDCSHKKQICLIIQYVKS
jgi:hypothetical protein